MHLTPLIHDLAIILCVAGIVTLVFQKIRQPVVLGYLVAGIVVGPFTSSYSFVRDIPNIKTLAELGVIFLMFSLGLEFSFRKLSRVGIGGIATATFEISIMFLLGISSAKALGWPPMDAFVLGAVLAISSTTIIIKALDELELKSRKFAENIFGILIVEDLVAILILVSLTTFAKAGSLSAVVMISSAAKLALVIGGWFLTGYFVVPRLIRYVGRSGSSEMLTIVSVGLCLFLVTFAAYFEYSAALGAFIMGSILAESPESHQISKLIQPVRDLFAAIFFVSVGMLIDPEAVFAFKYEVLFFTGLVVVGKIFGNTVGSLLFGKNIKNSIQTGFGLAQIGEFSFIIATLGISLGIMSEHIYPVVVAVSVLTTFFTPYLIKHSAAAARRIESIIPNKARNTLERYYLWYENRNALKNTDPKLAELGVRWLINCFIVTLIWVIFGLWGVPTMVQKFSNNSLISSLAWILALLASSPFLFAIYKVISPHKIFRDSFRKKHIAAFLSMEIVSFVWFSLLSFNYFPPKIVIIFGVIIGTLIFTQFYGHLGSLYSWFESSFTEVFKSGSNESKKIRVIQSLIPWNENLVRLHVHPDSTFTGKSLHESELRSKFGVNVVAIQRGSKTTVAPSPNTQMFPGDELLVLGSETHVDKVREIVELSKKRQIIADSIDGYELRSIVVHANSRFCGLTIRQSEIREHYSATVVGVDRSGKKIVNPDSDFEIQENDCLWIVGETIKLNEMFQRLKD